MISRATLDAAARVAEYAASRPIALNLSVMATPPTDDAGPAANATGQAAAPVPIDPGPQGSPDVQRNVAADAHGAAWQ